MKKIVLLASALALGSVAYAQDTTPAPASDPAAMAQPPAGGDTTMPATPDAATPDASATPDAAAAPAPAAGGDSTMTQPGAAPMGGNAPGTATGPNGPVSMTPTQGATDLPTCSKTVTDNCKQGASGGHHKAMRHKRR